jgi:2-polyprenyl-3-methyl-5-hydroxy-6-metoxy-1,4-benzoquinol methylase
MQALDPWIRRTLRVHSRKTLTQEPVRFVLFLLLLGGASASGGYSQSGFPLVRINTPYVQTPQEVVSAMLALAHVTSKDVVYDLGCGDGRIAITAARDYGAHAIGIDINPERVEESRVNASKAGVSGLVDFVQKDFFDADLSRATVVAMYLLPEVNTELLPKLMQSLKPGTRIVSHAFGFRDWKPEQAIEVSGCKVFLWTVPPDSTDIIAHHPQER